VIQKRKRRFAGSGGYVRKISQFETKKKESMVVTMMNEVEIFYKA
jgi:hypothetical protein